MTWPGECSPCMTDRFRGAEEHDASDDVPNIMYVRMMYEPFADSTSGTFSKLQALGEKTA